MRNSGNAFFLSWGRRLGEGVGEVDGFWQKILASVAEAATAGGVLRLRGRGLDFFDHSYPVVQSSIGAFG
jgi:hypothetical protein